MTHACLTRRTEMRITFKVIPEKNYFISLWQGDITDSEMLDSYMDFYQSQEWKPGFNELADLREIGISDISSAGLRQLAEYVNSFYREQNITETKTAVISVDPYPDGMAQLYNSLIEESPERIAVFNDPSQAELWFLNSG